MRLLALSDLHVRHAGCRRAVEAVEAHPEDWLILAGDLGESEEHLTWVLDTLAPRFARLLWVPGNHELWSRGSDPLRGVARYERLVELCRGRGVATPEDPWLRWTGPGGPAVVALMFLLYDYTFGPDGVAPEKAVAWAAETGILCNDEWLLRADPHPGRAAWCRDRLARTRARLDALPEGTSTILVNHWPLRRDLVRLYRIPRFVVWCGTRETEDWHLRYRARAVVHGHLHMRATDWRDGVRFEEVSLGYPRHFRAGVSAEAYLREILPGTGRAPRGGHGGPLWHR